MKKATFICAVLLLLTMVFAGCVSENGGPTAVPQGDTSPEGSYKAYTELKSTAFDNIMLKISLDPDYYMEIEPKLMAAGLVDMAVMSVTVLDGKEETVKTLEGLGYADIDVKRQGEEYVITFKGPDGKDYEQSCKYDASLDHMSSSMKDADGSEAAFFEYIKAGKGYAGQYYLSDGQEYTLITVYVDTEVAAFGVTPLAEKPGVLAGNTTLGPDFVKNSETYFLLEGEKITVSDNGKTKTM